MPTTFSSSSNIFLADCLLLKFLVDQSQRSTTSLPFNPNVFLLFLFKQLDFVFLMMMFFCSIELLLYKSATQEKFNSITNAGYQKSSLLQYDTTSCKVVHFQVSLCSSCQFCVRKNSRHRHIPYIFYAFNFFAHQGAE